MSHAKALLAEPAETGKGRGFSLRPEATAWVWSSSPDSCGLALPPALRPSDGLAGPAPLTLGATFPSPCCARATCCQPPAPHSRSRP